ncbi:MAG: hypothetical protein KAW87_08245 [Candidatus Cloacimonetes bacterium]|nr:hypothetical protein [Candidatus Cloacimonadota bacterium]
MSNNNGDLIEKKIIKRDKKGRILPGSKLAPAKRKRTDTEKLRLALKRAGKKQDPPIKWWDKVAEKAFVDKEIMKVVVNKLVPNINEITGAGGEPVSIILRKIIYGKEEKSKSGEAET